MKGMNATTGQSLDGTAHLVQSIGDILGTPLGTRPMRRDYGSLLFDLIDQPLTSATAMLLRAATAVALRRWEPRLKVTRIGLSGTPADGSLTITVGGTRTDLPAHNARTTLSIPLPATFAA
jgi:Phage baseplate assembly protein W